MECGGLGWTALQSAVSVDVSIAVRAGDTMAMELDDSQSNTGSFAKWAPFFPSSRLLCRAVTMGVATCRLGTALSDPLLSLITHRRYSLSDIPVLIRALFTPSCLPPNASLLSSQ